MPDGRGGGHGDLFCCKILLNIVKKNSQFFLLFVIYALLSYLLYFACPLFSQVQASPTPPPPNPPPPNPTLTHVEGGKEQSHGPDVNKEKREDNIPTSGQNKLGQKGFCRTFFFVPRKYHFKWLTCAGDLDKKQEVQVKPSGPFTQPYSLRDSIHVINCLITNRVSLGRTVVSWFAQYIQCGTMKDHDSSLISAPALFS